MAAPAGLAFDGSGNLYAVNWGNATVAKFAPSGSGSVFASSAGLNHPAGIAVNGGGNLYVASYWTTTIEKFSSSGADLGVFASGLATPDGLAFDSAGNLLVVNQNMNTIVKVGANGSGSVFATGGMNEPDFIARTDQLHQGEQHNQPESERQLGRRYGAKRLGHDSLEQHRDGNQRRSAWQQPFFGKDPHRESGRPSDDQQRRKHAHVEWRQRGGH